MSEEKGFGQKMVRPHIVEGRTPRITTACGNMYITINEIDGKPFELFVHIGKAGGCAMAMSEAICRLVSLQLRCGGDLKEIVHQLQGIRCASPHRNMVEETETLSCPDAIAQLLSREDVTE